MKLLSHDFTSSEKTVLLVLILLLMGLAYYNLVDQVVKRETAEALAEQEQLQTDLVQLQTQLAEMRRMQQELIDLDGKGGPSYMPSYNSVRAEMRLLNAILEPVSQYSISFSGVTRSGDQIRRNISLQFTVPSFNVAHWVLQQLAYSEYRCLLGNISYNGGGENVTLSLTCTFFETMVGGTPDRELPSG